MRKRMQGSWEEQEVQRWPFPPRRIPGLQLLRTKRANMDQIILPQRFQAEQRPGSRGSFLVGWQSGWLNEQLLPAMGWQSISVFSLCPNGVTTYFTEQRGKQGRERLHWGADRLVEPHFPLWQRNAIKAVGEHLQKGPILVICGRP